MIVLSLLFACSPIEGVDLSEADGPVIDLRRMDIPEPGEGQLLIRTPPMLVAPYTEEFFCYFGQYRGPDVGVSQRWNYAVWEINHHSQLKSFTDMEGELGEVQRCAEALMEGHSFTLFESTGLVEFGSVHEEEDVPEGLGMLDGMAMQLGADTLWMLETHYINPYDDWVLVEDALLLGTTPEDEVDIWVGSVDMDVGTLEIPAGVEHTEVFDCVWPWDVTVLGVHGHMHQLGSAFDLSWTSSEGTESIYSIEEWLPEYRDEPLKTYFGVDSFQIGEGDLFTTSCSWDNRVNDHAVTFPEEMCTSQVLYYPAQSPSLCVDDLFVEYDP